ncbi:MAG: hypothetical protein JZU70_10670 [Chlorobium sp.]|jgi:hypothetical protein|nr:hypothetical protein [Chlorobium sp.]
MEVIGKSKAHIVLDSCFHESGIYFSDHEKLIKCNPYCSNVKYLVDLDIFQWIFEVADPRNNPITAVFFVRQHETDFLLDDSYGQAFAAARLKNREHYNGKGKRICWEAVLDYPEFEKKSQNTFIGKASSEICLLHQHDDKTSVYFDTDICLDFTLSFPLNLMPEGILKYMTEAIMSQIMQQATESMLCKVQSDICCTAPELAVEGGCK